MPRRHLLTLLLMLSTTAAALFAATPYATTAQKAARFFRYGEWASASAMYQLMLDERTDSAGVFGHAIVAAGMLHDPEQQIELFTRALNAHQPIDSVLQATENASLEAEQSSLYEQFLYSVKEREPWLNRIIDSRLLDYYTFRDNGPGIVTMSEIMLAGLPDNERFLYSLARGKLLCDDIESAIAVYRRIVETHPESLDALLYLGNYYAGKDRAQARNFLERALKLRWTPYVAARLEKL